MARLVFLGRSGFVASALTAEAQRRGCDLLALGRPEIDLSHPTAVSRLCTLLQPADHIVVLAALTPEHGSEEDLLRINLAIMRNIVEAIRQTGAAHLTYLSSDAVYPWIETPVDETTKASPAGGYASMHAIREEMAVSLLSPELPIAVLRPCAIHGPGDTHAAYGPNRFFRTALSEGSLTLFGEGEERRPHLWIGDCVKWILEAVVTKFCGVLNIVPREAPTFAQVAEIIRRIAPQPVEVRLAPRRQPITHRTFSPDLRETLWPHLPCTPLPEAVEKHLQGLLEKRA
jgi:nucleoside-diphosphate-sugar epimerase